MNAQWHDPQKALWQQLYEEQVQAVTKSMQWVQTTAFDPMVGYTKNPMAFVPPSMPTLADTIQASLDLAKAAGIPESELLRWLSQALGAPLAAPAAPVAPAPAPAAPQPASPIFRAIRRTSAKQPGMLTLGGWLEDCWG